MKSSFTIALCDIVEFSNFVKNEALNRIINHHIDWFRKAIYHSIHKNNFPTDLVLWFNIHHICVLNMRIYNIHQSFSCQSKYPNKV